MAHQYVAGTARIEMHDAARVDRLQQLLERGKVAAVLALGLDTAERFAFDVTEGNRMRVEPERLRWHPGQTL